MRDDSTMRRARSSVSWRLLRTAPKPVRSGHRLTPPERSDAGCVRRWAAMLDLGVVGALPPAICAAQNPAPPDLPAPYHGTPIDKALKAREWPRAEELL